MRKACGRGLVASGPMAIRSRGCRAGARGCRRPVGRVSCEGARAPLRPSPGRYESAGAAGSTRPGQHVDRPSGHRTRGKCMSLIRQVWLLLTVTLALAFAGAIGVSVLSARQYLETQLAQKNNDAAQAIALTLSQQKG